MTVDLEYEPPADLPATFQRMPPQDRLAEQCVLGGMMLSPEAIGDVTEVLKSEHFYLPIHELIFVVILELYADGQPVDPITVGHELGRRGELNKVGGPPYLHELVNIPPAASSAAYYAEIVRRKAMLRTVAATGTRMTEMAYTGGDDAFAIVDAAQAELSAAVDANQDQRAQFVGHGWDEFLDGLEQKDRAKGVPTGIKDLDELTGGLHPGQMIVVAGRPAMGKSVLAGNFVRACSIKHGLPSIYFSLEMGRDEVRMRLLSAQARVALHHLRSRELTDDDWTRIAKHTPEISDAQLIIDDTPNLTMAQIKAKSRRVKQRYGLGEIVIDYLQLGESGTRSESRQLEVSAMSRGAKLLAKELEVPVVVLSQLNRGPEQRQDKKPAISDLRESGSIEQDADVVILLHREDAYDKESPRSGEADLIVAKHRNGPTATVTVAFQGHYSRFIDMAEE